MGIWSRLHNWFLSCQVLNKEDQGNTDFSNYELLKQAHLEIMCAYNMFDRVVDEDMVDCAIFSINAAEKRYSYIIKSIRQEQKANNTVKENGGLLKWKC